MSETPTPERLSFFHESPGVWSMARLCAFLCTVAALVVAWREPSQWQTVGAFIGGGAVSLLTRTRGDT